MSTAPQQKIGFIGLGTMGTPMAGHLLDAGHKLFVNTHGKTPEAIVLKATVCMKGTEVAQNAEIRYIVDRQAMVAFTQSSPSQPIAGCAP